TAAEQQRARRADPFGQLALQLVVDRVVAADQVRGGAAGALARSGVLQRVDHRELLRQPQAIVAAEVQQPAAIDLAAHAVAADDGAAHARTSERGALLALRGDARVQVGALSHRAASRTRARRAPRRAPATAGPARHPAARPGQAARFRPAAY